MSDVVVGASIQVDASSAAAASKTTKELKDNIKALKAEFENTKQGSAEQVEAFKKLKAAEEDLTKSTKNVSKAAEEGGGHFKNITEKVSGLPGPLGEAGEGANKLNLQLLKLLANPVGLVILAIVAALALLYKSFTNSFEGAEKMEQIFAGIKAAGQALIDNITKIAGAIVKLMKFDFSGAISDIKDVAKSAADAFTAMAKLTQKAQELHREQLQNDLEQAQRQKTLAVLRSQAQDEDVPIAKRKAALKELLKASEENAKQDVDLAKRTTENKLAQLTLEKDGERKNQDEINKLKIEQINVETERANEIRSIRKALTTANKQELAAQKEAAQKAAAEAKKRREELIEFTNKLSKIQQENELATITDTYEKEKKVIENRIADEKRQNNVSLQEKKINRVQYNELNAALEKQGQLQLDALTVKHNKEVADKEAAFQKELAVIRGKTSIDGITDQRQAERLQLQITHEQQLADALKNYKDDAAKLAIIRTALAEQYRAEQKKLEEKFKKEDDQNKFKAEETRLKAVVDDQKKAFGLRVKAVDDEQALVQKAFDNKLITEADFNTKMEGLTKARLAIRKEEQDQHEKIANAIGQTFGSLADLVGKQTAIGKAFAIAQATIDTYSSAVKAYNAMADIPVVGPALGAVAAASAIAAGIANVKKIISVQVPGNAGGSGGSAPSGIVSPSAPVAPAQISTTFKPENNQTSGSPSSNRVYVLDADVQSAAERNARLNRAARLGGN